MNAEHIRPIHPFPARMAPAIAIGELQAYDGSSLAVLDPMAGSGTTVVHAKMLGHRARGFDIDPLAVITANAWCTSMPASSFNAAAESVLNGARKRLRTVRARDAYPVNADDETKEFARYWFHLYARKQLRALSEAILRVDRRSVRNLLWTAYSRMIITKSNGVSLAMDVSHSRPHRVYDKSPSLPFTSFPRAVEYICRSSPFLWNCRLDMKSRPPAILSPGDARRLPTRSQSVDIVITSPPYLNAIDYLRCSKFALVWMSHAVSEIRRTRSISIGAEVGRKTYGSNGLEWRGAIDRWNELPARWQHILYRYVCDMTETLREVRRVLKPGGSAVFVVGDSMIKGVLISNSTIISTLAEGTGLRVMGTKVRPLEPSRRYLPPPTSHSAGDALTRRMRNETIIRLRRD